MSTLTISHLIY